MKIGRNAPCPCGSGKKYKKCCLTNENVSNDLLWRRLGEAYDRLSKSLMNHGRQVFGTDGFVETIDEFFLYPEDTVPEELLAVHEQLFFPWYLFNWICDPDDEEGDAAPACLEETTIAASYKKSKGAKLDPLERRLIDAIEGRPFTFYEVIDCQPGIGYRVKDFFLGDVIDVKEKMGSENVQKGDLLFGRAATIDAVSMLFGSGSIIIRPTWKPYLIHFRKWLTEEEDPITIKTLTDFDFEIREVYFDVFEKVMRPPELQNTDGDPLHFHTLYYDIESPEVAFQALKSLSAVELEEELRSQATLTDDGSIEKIEIPYNKKTERVEAIKTMIEDFGREELNPLYINFAIELLHKISRMRKLDIQRGRMEIWAAAIIYVIARLNFLFDPESDVALSPDTICDYFDTVKSTVGNKASLIQKTGNLYYGAEGFCRQDIIDATTFIKTPEGFILPKNMLGNFEININHVDRKAFVKSKKRSIEYQRPNRSGEIDKQAIEKKSKNDKQLSLFGDE